MSATHAEGATGAAAEPSALAPVVAQAQVVVVCGTGGVGKTTVSAALGLGAALAGRRALVMTIDPARRLADSLGVSGKLNEATPIDLQALLGVSPPPGGSLDAMMLDAKTAFDEMVSRFAKDDDTRDRILGNDYYQRASESLSGSQEYMAMEKLRQVAVSGDYDLVVLDTPPTRNALDFLEAPGRLLAMLSEGALKWLVKPRDGSFSSSRAGKLIFGKGQQAMISVFERFVGDEVLGGLAEFVTAFSGLLDGMGARAGEVMELLRQEDTAFLLVASPNRIALSEALYFHDRLAEAQIPFRGFVINRVRPSASLGKLPADAADAGFPERDEPGWSAAIDAVWANHRARARWAAVDRHHIEALKAHCGQSLPYVEVPELEGEVQDLEGLQLLLEHLR